MFVSFTLGCVSFLVHSKLHNSERIYEYILLDHYHTLIIDNNCNILVILCNLDPLLLQIPVEISNQISNNYTPYYY